MHHQFITPAYLHTCTGYRVPCTADAGWLSENQYHIYDALAVYARVVPDIDPTTIKRVLTATRDGDALVVLYQHGGETTARVLFPSAVMVSKDDHLAVRAFCTYRREIRSFRVDRFMDSHAFVLPGETVAA